MQIQPVSVEALPNEECKHSQTCYNEEVWACRGEWLALTKQEIAAVLPGSGHTLEALSRVAQEAEERAPEMRSLEAAWRV